MSIFPKGIFDAEKQEAPELTKNTARKRRQERRQKAGPERRGPRLQIWPACPPLRKHRPGRGRRSRPEEGPPPFSWELRPLPPVPLPSRIRTPSALAVLPAGAPSPGPVPPAPEIFPESPARLQEANAGTSRERIAAAAAPDRTQAPGAPGTLSHHPAFYTVRPYIINIFFLHFPGLRKPYVRPYIINTFN